MLSRWRAWARNSPWVLMAIMIHVMIMASLSILYVGHRMKAEADEKTAIAIAPPRPEPAPDIVEEPEVIDRHAIPKNDEAEVVSFAEDVYVPITEPSSAPEDLHLDRGDPTALDNLPGGGTTGGTAIGVGAGGHFGVGRPSAFGGRRLGHGVGHGRAGGVTQGTERAVLDGLRWLARHQNPDGSWGAAALKDRCVPGTPCYDPKEYYTDNYDPGLTGLALLAFLGAGYSHESKQDIVDTALGKRHKIGEIVKEGLIWLVHHQNPDGSFSKDKSFIYNEALATLALTESYGLTHNRYWQEPAQHGIDFITQAQRPSPLDAKKLWGWRYASRMEVEGIGDTDSAVYSQELHEADTSATGWAVMALKSAELAGLKVNQANLDGAFEFAKFVTGPDGLVGYLDPRGAGQPVGGKDDQYDYHTATMSAVDMCIRIFSRHDPDDPFLDLAAKQVVADLPAVSKDHLSVDYYYWYYGSLALNQLDGPDSPRRTGKYWSTWNKSMVDALLALQDHKERACSNGGWIIPDRWSYAGGPLYATAINVLTLEVYYRYQNAFGVGEHS
jgi:hypothetical protein